MSARPMIKKQVVPPTCEGCNRAKNLHTGYKGWQLCSDCKELFGECLEDEEDDQCVKFECYQCGYVSHLVGMHYSRFCTGKIVRN